MSPFNSGVVIGALLVGVVCGIAPLVMGIRRDQLSLGLGGFAACVVAGFLFGLLLAVPTCGVFVWLILREEKRRKTMVPPQGYYPPPGYYPPQQYPQPIAPPPPQIAPLPEVQEPPAAEGPKVCPICKYENIPGANFCQQCGQRLG